MTYPNSPLDAQPVVFGWPWHGLIEGSGATAGVLRLDDGREIACRYADYHNTSLWDIGLPAPEVATDDASEQWLSKAIIRSLYPGQGRCYSAAYQGINFGERYPVYVQGYGVLRREFSPVGDDANDRLRVTGNVLGTSNYPVAEVFVPYSALGFGDIKSRFPSVLIHALDNSPDGRRALYAIRPFNPRAWAAISRAIIEVELLGDPATGFGLAVNVIAPYPPLWEASRYPMKGDEGSFNMAVWRGPEDWEVARLNEVPAGVTIIETFPVGVATLDMALDCPMFAWYGMTGGVEIVRYRWEVSSRTTYGGDLTSRSLESVVTTTSRLTTGGASVAMADAELVDFTSDGHPATGYNYRTQSRREVVGVEVFRSEVSEGSGISGGTDADFPDQLPVLASYDFTTPSTSYPADMVVLSNKVLAVARKDVQFSSGQREYWCGDAITPAGVDSGLYKKAFPVGGSFYRGAFNPITGEVVRNSSESYQAWV